MVTAIRAAIMLTVLVGLPAAWVYYGPLPNGAQRVVDRFFAAAREAVDWDAADAPPATAPALTPIAASTATQLNATPPTAPAQPTLAQQMEPLLVQLRQLGVAEYALEPWGQGGRLFRFHCEMPLASGGAGTEQFEAIAADPHASVQQVVADVSSWHAARLVGGSMR